MAPALPHAPTLALARLGAPGRAIRRPGRRVEENGPTARSRSWGRHRGPKRRASFGLVESRDLAQFVAVPLRWNSVADCFRAA